MQNATFNLEDGTIVPLAEPASVQSRSGPNAISRENVQRKIVVYANVAGRDLRGTVDDIRANVSKNVNFPQGLRDDKAAIISTFLKRSYDIIS